MSTALLVGPLGIALWVAVTRHSPALGLTAFYLTLLAEVVLAWASGRRWPSGGRPETTMTAIDAMAGIEFERYVAGRFDDAGWRVQFTPTVGDYGVDLIAEKDGRYVAVQCKRYGKSIGVAAVQQVVAGARHHGCTRSIVVSNQEFTSAAKQLARTHNCQLIGRKVLQGWVHPPREAAR